MKKLLFNALLCIPVIAISQTTFTNTNNKLVNSGLRSGCAIGVADMNGDGLDDIVRLDRARNLQIEYQNTDGNFTRLNYGSISGSGSEWGMAIADLDQNGYNDVLVGGAYNGVKILTANSTGTDYNETVLGGPNIFVQNVNFADIDNNGTIDIFACHDDGMSSPYSGNGSGTMTYDASLISTPSTIASDNSGNYGTIWTDYDNDGDIDLYISKCRLSAGGLPMDGRRVNLLFQNDGSGNYTDVALAAGLRPYGQSWASSFEDIDNDGDMDCIVVNHDISSVIYENNGDGTFTDITAASGIASELLAMGSGGIQIIMEDFDNDMNVDLFITARSGSHRMFKNNGNKTFTEMASPFTLPSGPSRIQSAAVGDLNNDGFIDVMAGFATGYNNYSSNPDVIYLNDGNANNWSEIRLNGLASNINGIGARIELVAGGITQIREVRSGESYGTMNSLMTHFGLGANTTITSITVKWPSGTVDTIINPNINESIEITEGDTLGSQDFTQSIFTIFPNPTKDRIIIQGLQQLENASFEIYDITGKIVLNKTQLSLTQNQIDLTRLNSGVYFAHLKTNNTTYIHKIIKE
ncbi:FG-GAP-like repeat-containing protein [Ichthyenterobacterium magnum]|nr:FG-GAP-like repeat-containing protein [Ichthyenterobacterium magnum]